MTQKTLTSTMMASFFALAFSAAFLLGSVGPAINFSPAQAAQDYVA